MLMVPDLVAHEYDLFGDFTCDLVIGDSVRKTFCFVEFEDAKKDSIFQKTSGRATPKWSNRFEQGFSQIVDWMYKLADLEKSDAFETRFGTRSIDFMGALIIGRDKYLSASENRRLKWREKFVLINSQRVHCLTFDELLQVLENKLTRLLHSSYNQRRGR